VSRGIDRYIGNTTIKNRVGIMINKTFNDGVVDIK
jgi:hypothetical protein